MFWSSIMRNYDFILIKFQLLSFFNLLNWERSHRMKRSEVQIFLLNNMLVLQQQLHQSLEEKPLIYWLTFRISLYCGCPEDPPSHGNFQPGYIITAAPPTLNSRWVWSACCVKFSLSFHFPAQSNSFKLKWGWHNQHLNFPVCLSESDFF